MMMLAVFVVGQRLDYSTLCNLALGASGDHALKFRLERGEAGDSLLDLDQTRAGDAIRSRA